MPSRAYSGARQRAAALRRIEHEQLQARAALARGLTPSKAERTQPGVLVGDFALRDRARLLHPSVRWWWGERRNGQQSGAYCYLCDAFIATWHPKYPMPVRAGDEILAHRDSVHGPGQLPQGSMTPGL